MTSETTLRERVFMAVLAKSAPLTPMETVLAQTDEAVVHLLSSLSSEQADPAA